MIRRRRTRHQGMFHVPEISLTPLIDTALTLLIIFMLTSPMLRLTIRIDLPESKTRTSSAVSEETIVVDVDSKNNLFFNGSAIQLPALQKKIGALVAAQPNNNVVYINGDQNIKYQAIVDLIDGLNAIEGVKHVALVTQKAAAA